MSVPTQQWRAPGANETAGDLVRRLAAAQKSPVGVPAYMRWVNRRAGGYLAVAAHVAGRTPSQVTIASAVCSFVGIALLALARPTTLVAASVAVMLALGFALDSADGQLARLRGGGTRAGEWLDHVVDCFKSCAMHVAVAVSLYRFAEPQHAAVLLVPLAFGTVQITHYFGMMLRDQLLRGDPTVRAAGERASAIKALLLLPVDYGVLCLSFLLLAHTTAFLWVYGALFAGNLAFAAYSLLKAYRSLAQQVPASPVRAQRKTRRPVGVS
jgi:phosphatidylglycerophosphate synthase